MTISTRFKTIVYKNILELIINYKFELPFLGIQLMRPNVSQIYRDLIHLTLT